MTGGTSTIWNDSGSDLWLVADAATSVWSRRIDWHLNFQAMKSERHQSFERPEQIKIIEEQWPHDTFNLKIADRAPLLIASSGLLPCSKTVFITFLGDVNSWVSECVRTWNGLGKPPVRVFLPDLVSPELFQAAWVKVAGISESIPDTISADKADQSDQIDS